MFFLRSLALVLFSFFFSWKGTAKIKFIMSEFQRDRFNINFPLTYVRLVFFLFSTSLTCRQKASFLFMPAYLSMNLLYSCHFLSFPKCLSVIWLPIRIFDIWHGTRGGENRKTKERKKVWEREEKTNKFFTSS